MKKKDSEMIARAMMGHAMGTALLQTLNAVLEKAEDDGTAFVITVQKTRIDVCKADVVE